MMEWEDAGRVGPHPQAELGVASSPPSRERNRLFISPKSDGPAKSRRNTESKVFNPLCISPSLGGEEIRTRLSTRSFLRSHTRSFLRSHTRSFSHSHTRPFLPSHTRSFSRSHTRSFSRQFAGSFDCAFDLKIRDRCEIPSPRLGRVRVGLT